MLFKQRVSYEVCNLQAYGMNDPKGYYHASPATFMHNLPPQVLMPIKRNSKSSTQQEHSPRSESGVHGYGSKAKLSQVYPYEFCDTSAACLSKFLERDSFASHLALVTDLAPYAGDSCLLGLSKFLEQEYSHLSANPIKDSKLTQDKKCSVFDCQSQLSAQQDRNAGASFPAIAVP